MRIRIFVGEPEIGFDRSTRKLVVKADDVVLVIPLDRILSVLEEQDIICKCTRV